MPEIRIIHISHGKSKTVAKCSPAPALPDNPYERRRVAFDPKTTPEQFHQLARHPEFMVRYAIASSDRAPVENLVYLSADSTTYVRPAVANNPRTPQSVLDALANDPDRFVQAVAQRHLGEHYASTVTAEPPQR